MAGKVMTKGQMITYLAQQNEMTKAATAEFLNSIARLAVAEIKKGQFVLPGFGKMVKSQRKARMGRNPQTGEAIKIPARTVVKFRVTKAFKEAVLPIKK